MFLLDTLDNPPRMVQTSLWKLSGVPTVQYKSPKGNIYSMNDPHTLVAMVSNVFVHAHGYSGILF